ncbi:MAG TPA: rod shape-determining protein MreC [Acidimicrobiales bacterium]|nr:rod shape-determining protein MreC [Acidimicrobiales bacterium]
MGRRKRPRRSRRSLTIGLLVLASITIITLDYRGGGHGAVSALKRAAHDTFAPVQSGVDAVVRPIGSFLAGAVHYGSVQNQNAKLRAEIGRLEQQVLQGAASRQELKTLEQLDHLPWANGIPTVTAQVVGLNTSDFASTIRLGVGTSSGVEVGMPVSGGAGLVGQVTEAWSSGSTVRLITDPRSAVSVRYGSGASAGDALMVGAGPGKALSVQYIVPGTALRRRELLTTSGLQNASYPPDVPVATVTSYSSTPSSTQETVSAQPVADLPALQFVDVMLWEPGQ